MTAGPAEAIVDVHGGLVPRCADLFIAVFNGPPWNESWTAGSSSERLAEITGTPGFAGVALAAGNDVTGVALGQAETLAHRPRLLPPRDVRPPRPATSRTRQQVARRHLRARPRRRRPLPAHRSWHPGPGLLRKAWLHRGSCPHHDDPPGYPRSPVGAAATGPGRASSRPWPAPGAAGTAGHQHR